MAGMGVWGAFGVLAVLAVVAVVVLGLPWGARSSGITRDGTSAVGGDPARDTLRRRYAEGQIDEEEFERRLTSLTWH
jgi:putative membrane protein